MTDVVDVMTAEIEGVAGVPAEGVGAALAKSGREVPAAIAARGRGRKTTPEKVLASSEPERALVSSVSTAVLQGERRGVLAGGETKSVQRNEAGAAAVELRRSTLFQIAMHL